MTEGYPSDYIEGFGRGPRDFPEDYRHENGQYFNLCVRCQWHFVGHKRRVLCRECSEIPWYVRLWRRIFS